MRDRGEAFRRLDRGQIRDRLRLRVRPPTCAVAAIDPEPGDEIITTPITDMGALAAILYQGAIPVFADVDPLTGNITADTSRRA